MLTLSENTIACPKPTQRPTLIHLNFTGMPDNPKLHPNKEGEEGIPQRQARSSKLMQNEFGRMDGARIPGYLGSPCSSLETLILSWNPSQKQMRDFLAMLYDF